MQFVPRILRTQLRHSESEEQKFLAIISTLFETCISFTIAWKSVQRLFYHMHRMFLWEDENICYATSLGPTCYAPAYWQKIYWRRISDDASDAAGDARNHFQGIRLLYLRIKSPALSSWQRHSAES
jgi:hypothetical protein